LQPYCPRPGHRVFLRSVSNRAIRFLDLSQEQIVISLILSSKTLGPEGIRAVSRLAKAGKTPCSHLAEQAPSLGFLREKIILRPALSQGPWYAPYSPKRCPANCLLRPPQYPKYMSCSQNGCFPPLHSPLVGKLLFGRVTLAELESSNILQVRRTKRRLGRRGSDM
jgi:hypothetical protein